MNGKRLLALLAMLFMFFVACLEDARSQPIQTGTARPLPAQGPWWNPAEHGIYYHVDVGPTGFLTVMITLYRPDGTPTFLVMQGQFQESPGTIDSHERIPTGRLDSPLYRMVGGACLGCDYRNPRTVDAGLGSASIQFYDDGTAEFRHGERVTPIERYPLYTSAAGLPRNRLDGRWIAFTTGTIDSTGFSTGKLDLIDIGRPYTSGWPLLLPSDEVSRFDCVHCESEPLNYGGNLYFRARTPANFEEDTYSCNIGGCIASGRVSRRLNERDGSLQTDSGFIDFLGGGHPAVTVMRRVGPRAGQTDTPHHDVTNPWLPQQGLWWNRAEHGIYYNVAVGPDQFVMVTITLFDEAGEPTFLVMQGQLNVAPYNGWAATDVIGWLDSPLYEMRNGQCLDCAYRNSQTVPSRFGSASLIFLSGRHAEFRWQGRRIPIETYPLYADVGGLPQQRLLGRYFAQLRGAGNSIESGVIDIVPGSAPGTGNATVPALALHCERCDAGVAGLVARGDALLTGETTLRYVRADAASPTGSVDVLDFHETDRSLSGRPSRPGAPDALPRDSGLQLELYRVGDVPSPSN